MRRLRNERREDGSEDYTIVHEAPPKDMLLDPASFGLELEKKGERGYYTQLVWQAIDSGDVLGLECSLGELMTMSTGMLAHDDVGILPAVLNAIDVRDFTAFLRACDTGEVECVKLLRKAGCDVTAWDKIGRTGLGLAAARGHAAVVRSLLGPPRIYRRSPATPERRTTGSIDLRDGNDETPLMLACLEGHVECMKLLLEAGCDQTGAMDCALRSGSDAAVQVIRDAAVQMIQDAARQQALPFKLQAQELSVAKQWTEAKTAVGKALKLTPDDAELQLMAKNLDRRAAQALAVAERVAEKHAAQLLASLEGAPSSPAQPGVDQAEKARKKKEKRRRQQEAKQASAAAAAAEREVNVAAEVSCHALTTTTTSVAQAGIEDVDLLGVTATNDIAQPELEPELEPEPDSAAAHAERCRKERVRILSHLATVKMSSWTARIVMEWVGLTELTAENMTIVRAVFESLEIEGDELVDLRLKQLQKKLHKSGATDADSLAKQVLDARDAMLALQEGQPEATGHDQASDGSSYETFNVLMLKEREANEKLVKNRAAALKARAEGFPIPVRRVGDIDCETLKDKLHESVPVEGDLGRSALQDLVVSAWHPMKVVVVDGDAKEIVNADDPMMRQMEGKYPGLGVAGFILSRWQELQLFNPSGGYSVEIPWNEALERELTPAELMTIMMQGKGKKKKKKKQAGGRR